MAKSEIYAILINKCEYYYFYFMKDIILILGLKSKIYKLKTSVQLLTECHRSECRATYQLVPKRSGKSGPIVKIMFNFVVKN